MKLVFQLVSDFRDSRDNVTNTPVEQTAKVFLFEGQCKNLIYDREKRG